MLLRDLASPRADAAGWVRAWPLGAGVGLAAVQTARGLLLHQARLAARPHRRLPRRCAHGMELPPAGRAVPRHRRHRGAATRPRWSPAPGWRCTRWTPAWAFASRSCAMHEMSLAEGMLQLVEDGARANAATGVKAVWLEIGALAQVEVEALRFCFDAVTRGTLAEGARLEIVTPPGLAWCMPCGAPGAHRAARRRLPALRQPPVAGGAGRRDARHRNRDRLKACELFCCACQSWACGARRTGVRLRSSTQARHARDEDLS